MMAKYFLPLLAMWLAVAPSTIPSLEAQQADLPPEVIAYADTVLHNGKILTADDNFSMAEAVAIRDGKFLAVGPSQRILRMAGPKTRRIDLRGKTAVPGIIDVHQHPFTEGIMAYWVAKNQVPWEGRLPEMNEMERQIGVGWTDGAMALRDIKRATDAAKPGEILIIPQAWGRGVNLCQVTTLAQVDAVSPNNPVIFIGYVNVWPYAINSKAANVVGLPVGPPTFTDQGTMSSGAVGVPAEFGDWAVSAMSGGVRLASGSATGCVMGCGN